MYSPHFVWEAAFVFGKVLGRKIPAAGSVLQKQEASAFSLLILVQHSSFNGRDPRIISVDHAAKPTVISLPVAGDV